MRLRHVLALVLLSAAGNALGQGLNVVSAVDLSDAGGAIVLSVRGTRPPNFTTFSMTDPPRFVIDLSEARFQGVPDEVPVNDGTIRLFRNLSYGSDSSSIARIMIAFAADVDPPDVQVQGTTLVVRVAKLSAPAAIAQQEASPRAEPAPATAAAQPAAAPQPSVREPAVAEAAAQASPQPSPAEEPRPAAPRKDDGAEPRDPVIAPKQPAQQATQDAAPASDDVKERVAEAKRQPEETTAADAGAERKGQEAAERKAEAKRQREEAIAAAKAEGERKRQEAAERKAEAKRQREEAIAAAKAEGERKRQEAAERKEEAKRQREEAIAAAKAEAERQRDEKRAARAAALAAAGPAAQLREVGFRQVAGGSRVFVRTSVPPRFTVQDAGENVIRIELENTHVLRRNDARFLDTSFFPSAVAMITPSTRGSSYVVEIRLKEKVPYQQKIEGDMLAIDFERPAAAAVAHGDDAALEGASPAEAATAEAAPEKQPAAKEPSAK